MNKGGVAEKTAPEDAYVMYHAAEMSTFNAAHLSNIFTLAVTLTP